MTTDELKKLAEEAGKETWAFGSFARGEIRIGPAKDLKHDYFATMLAEGQIPWNKTEASKDAFNKAAYIAAANPAAILKLLAINAELVEAVKEAAVLADFAECWITDPAIEGVNRLKGKGDKLRDALAKAEGGEL